MSAPNAQIQWYLAREGKQYGPLTEVELSKFVELGHLLPTDLLWREGFPDWQPALSVFPAPSAASAPVPQTRPEPEPAMAGAPRGAQSAAAGSGQQSLAAQAAAAWPRQGEPQPGAQPQHQAARAQPRQGGQAQAAQAARGQPVAQRQPARGYPQHDRAQRREPQLGAHGQAERKRIDPAEFDEDTDFEPGGRVLRKAITFLVILAVLGGIGYGAWTFRAPLMSLAGLSGGGSTTSGAATIGFDRRALEAPPLKGLEGAPAQIDANMQQAALWRLLKREFPEWYDERVKEISQYTDKNEAAAKTAQALVALRRQNLSGALSASIPRVRLVASTFFENLAELRKTSEAACFEFIARGEASPTIVTMLQGSPQVPKLQAQMVAVYEAIADGRKSPRAYPSPKREDYEKLAADLQQRYNWTQADLQLFTNEQALAQASQGKVCQLVHDWFSAQLDVKDPDMQVRLLVDSLKPVVAG